jgi:hypothetical protein
MTTTESIPPRGGSDPSSDDKPAGSMHSPLRIPILIALIASAVAAFVLQPRVIAAVRAEKLPAALLVAAPAAFALVVVFAALDAWRMAKRRGYFRGPTLLMLAACVAFLGLLLPSTFDEYRARTSPPTDSVAHYDALFLSRDPRVRALVMEAAGFRPGPPEPVAALVLKGLDDSDPLVVKAAVAAVEHRAGVTLEGADDAVSRARTIAQTWSAH